jgi:hypothetical protein
MAIFRKNIQRAAVFLFLLLQIFACSSMPDVTVEALPQYDALFSNEDGWTGGDGVYSVGINAHTLAWFFGDTWIGQIKNNRHVNATLVNNSVAIQHGRSPTESEIDFYFGSAADGSPDALIRPADGRGWFWIFDGVMTAEGLYLFLIQIERTAGDEVFGFKVIGAWLGQIDNPKDPPSRWRIRQFKIPWVEFSVSRGMLWGSALLQVNNFLYIYGTTQDRQNAVPQKHMILARVPVSMLANFSRWRFYADGHWVSDFTQASRLCENVPHEYSVSYLPALKQFAVVYSQDGLSENILARLSPEPQGPWSGPIQIYQCPEADWDESIFCYAAKAHTILSEVPDALVITYIANSVDFDKTVNDARLYRPRFLRATFNPKKK